MRFIYISLALISLLFTLLWINKEGAASFEPYVALPSAVLSLLTFWTSEDRQRIRVLRSKGTRVDTPGSSHSDIQVNDSEDTIIRIR